MRNIYIFLLVVISSNISNAQFSPRTEYEYLKLINEQHQKALIEDNINNAEIAAQKFINDTFNIYTGLFYGALANSYKLLNKRSLSLYYLTIQRVLFPFDDESISGKLFFNEVCFANNLTDSLVDYYWNTTKKENLSAKAQDRLLLILKLMIPLYSKHLTGHLYRLGIYFLDSKNEAPQWLTNWFYLTKIGISEKRKRQIINNNDTSNISIFQSTLSKKRKLYIYRKSIRFYTSINAHNKAKSLTTEYSKQQLSLFRRCQLLWYKSKLKFTMI